tara:strand:- start:2691 stop:3113 length:423 start_codon:yes stop_codon:yes gene_type:complete
MRPYIGRYKVTDVIKEKFSIGYIGESIFNKWFTSTYQDEFLIKQKADRDYDKIDFVCSKGYKYQVKCTEKKSYTFNCHKDNIEKSLTSDVYVFIQIVEGYAYIEQLRNREYVKQNVMQSIFKNSMCYVNAERLLQHTLKI